MNQETPKTLEVTVPDGGWSFKIERILEQPNEIWVLARVERAPGMATQAIATVTAALPAGLPAKPLRVFVAGKTWAWKNDEPYEFVPNLKTVEQRPGTEKARVLFPR